MLMTEPFRDQTLSYVIASFRAKVNKDGTSSGLAFEHFQFHYFSQQE